MAKNPIYVSIEMRPYLVDYTIHFYGEHPIRANEKSKLLQMLSEYLTHPPVNYRPLQPSPRLITFELPYNKILDIRRNNYISPENFSKIQSYFYGKFQYHFFEFMDSRCLHHCMPFKSSIIEFMDDNNISWDRFQYDSLKRMYLRHRVKFRKSQRFLSR
ncbi:MAG TPA: hypothetical protein PKM34_01330 [Bacteroidales bacterium]|nr:hypothetical protein [Bacteroidales bacterium]